MIEALDWVGDGMGRCRRLLGNLSSLALLAISTPGGDLGSQAGPEKTAVCPDSWVGQIVNGVKDGLPEAGRDQGAENVRRSIHHDGGPLHLNHRHSKGRRGLADFPSTRSHIRGCHILYIYLSAKHKTLTMPWLHLTNV
jgi:hypothetical protein